MPDAQDPFIAFLIQRGIPFHATPDGLEVQGDVTLSNSGITQLPDGLHIVGALSLFQVEIPRLPERLTVERSLALRQSPITELPDTLYVKGDMTLEYSLVSRMPKGLRSGGSLKMRGTPIRDLPEDMDIGGYLNLEQTPVRRLPRNLRVHDAIIPPSGLEDIVAFMGGRIGEAHFAWRGSGHHQIELRAQLAPFPDLLTVVERLGRLHMLRIINTLKGGCEARVEWIGGA